MKTTVEIAPCQLAAAAAFAAAAAKRLVRGSSNLIRGLH